MRVTIKLARFATIPHTTFTIYGLKCAIYWKWHHIWSQSCYSVVCMSPLSSILILKFHFIRLFIADFVAVHIDSYQVQLQAHLSHSKDSLHHIDKSACHSQTDQQILQLFHMQHWKKKYNMIKESIQKMIVGIYLMSVSREKSWGRANIINDAKSFIQRPSNRKLCW